MLALFSSQAASEQPASLELRSTSSGNVVYGSHKQIYQEVKLVRALSTTKFPVYLVNSKMTKLNYAMKVFLHKNGSAELYFKNESRFASLRHPNVIRNLFFESEREVLYNNVPTKISYTIMEYAPHGNLFNFVKNHREEVDDKLVRTYFRQLVEGLEFLHKGGVSHMDLKLDNLLLDQNYTLKIADFDMAHFRDDAIILSHGTKYFRAPEVRSGSCSNTNAADIFSVGITLFTMKTQGVLPQFEEEIIGGVNFEDLLKNDVNKFWVNHARAQKHTHVYFDQDFKDLFISMTRQEIAERATIDKIKASKWYNGPVYTTEELKTKMQRIFDAKKKGL